jgi:hypothetical protein
VLLRDLVIKRVWELVVVLMISLKGTSLLHNQRLKHLETRHYNTKSLIMLTSFYCTLSEITIHQDRRERKETNPGRIADASNSMVKRFSND